MQFDAKILNADPAKIAMGGAAPEAVRTAESTPNQESPACAAALSGYRTALMFRTLFTYLVLAVAGASATAILVAIYKAMSAGVDLGVGITLVSGFVGSGAAIFIGKRMNESIAVARTALQDVGKYCGSEVEQKVQGK